MKLKITNPILNELIEAYNKVISLIDEESGCACSLEAKRDISMYVNSWIQPNLETAIQAICGDRISELNCKQATQYYSHVFSTGPNLKKAKKPAKYKALRSISAPKNMSFVPTKDLEALIAASQNGPTMEAIEASKNCAHYLAMAKNQ